MDKKDLYNKNVIRLRRQRILDAGNYIKTHARAIDKALYSCVFEKSTKSVVLDALNKYANTDGGYGKGIALDFMYQGSTPQSTTIALQAIREIKIITNVELIDNAIEYLLSSRDASGYWHSVTDNIESMPRAQWFNSEYIKFKEFALNPTAEIAGYIYNYGGGLYRNLANEIIEDCKSYLKNSYNEIDMRDAICVMRLIRMLPSSQGDIFVKLLRPRLHEMICTDSREWGENVFTPLSIFQAPYDPLYDQFSKSIEHNIDYMARIQCSDGHWEPNREWGQFDETYASLLPKIRARYTLENLLILKNFDRLS